MTKLPLTLLAATVSALALPAAAQVGGVAIADPDGAVANTRAWTTARGQIQTTYKAQIDQAQARGTQAQTQIRALLTTIDTDKDGQISQTEQTAHANEVRQVQTLQQTAQADVARIEQPVSRAQQYALEQLQAQLPTAVQNVVRTRNVSLLVSPQAVLFAAPTADITSSITTELDRLVPSVTITPPANWQPGQARQGAAPAAGGAPATTAPATTAPATPARRNNGR